MKLLLLDSNSLINRAFYALPNLRDRSGRYTGALHGFVSMLAGLIKSERPTHIAAAFDVHQPTFRHLKYDGYKATRHPMPEELRVQVPAMKELLTAMGIRVVELPGYEADDVIGTLAERSTMPTVIVSGDKDVLQLVSDKTTVLHTKRGISDVIRYTPKVLAEEGLTPNGVIEMKALMGDHSDNIPGVPGVGEKTAKELVTTYGTIENLYAHLDEIKGKLREKLADGRESADFSHWLATIERNAPLPMSDSLEEFRFSEPLPYAAKKLMDGYDFRKLLDRFTFADPLASDLSSREIERIEISDEPSLDAFLNECKRVKTIAFCVSDDHVDLACDETRNLSVRYAYDLFGESLSLETILSKLRALLSEPDMHVTVFDLKATYRLLELSEKELFAADDLMLMAYIADCGESYESPADLIRRYGLPEDCLAAGLVALAGSLRDKMRQARSLEVYEQIELPLVPVLYDMEKSGFRVDRAALDELTERYSAELDTVQGNIYALAGHSFNVNSPKQLAEVLYDELHLPAGKKRSTSADVLSSLEELHPIVDLVLRYRTLSKLISVYLIGMKTMIDSKGRIHTLFNQAMTSTGRLSSSEPNLQNIPVREAEGREIRGAFIPSDGNLLISADYSQIELRLLADFCGDESLIDAFKRGMDIHAATAAKVFGVEESEVTSKMRRDAKAVNFGIIYGISDFGLSKNVGCSVREAHAFIEKYLASYPKIKEYMSASVAFAKENGYVKTKMGRIRNLPEITSSDHNIRGFGERAAMNMPLQGTAADIIKLAMIGVYNGLKKAGLSAKLILQVHDELILDCPVGEVEAAKEVLKREMENVISLQVPLTVSVAVGKNWKEAK
ncbi:MAG: DNA polymerase I [Clostridia bacterium]|nr:DNA polymerase I [Clostridia bacterium]